MNGRIYYFDKIRILFHENTGLIASKISIENLKNNCGSANLLHTSGNTLKKGFKSKIEVSAPNPLALKLLEESIKNTKHTISYVELANDILFTTEFMAELKTRTIINNVRRKYVRKCSVIDDSKTDEAITYSDDHFSDVTCYLNTNKSKFVLYKRSSKLSVFPCFHSEFRIQGSNKIKSYLGLNSIKDIVNFNCEDNFLKLKDRFITFEKIDHEEHGRFLQNMKRGSTNPGIIRKGMRAGARLAEPVRASHMLMRINDIDAPCQLRDFYMNKRKEVKEKIKNGGALTAWENKISKLNSNKLNSFFQMIPEPL